MQQRRSIHLHTILRLRCKTKTKTGYCSAPKSINDAGSHPSASCEKASMHTIIQVPRQTECIIGFSKPGASNKVLVRHERAKIVRMGTATRSRRACSEG